MENRLETRKLFDDGLLSRAEAARILEPHLSRIADCIAAGLHAWDAFQEAIPAECLALSSCTIAGIVHNHMVDHAKRVFSRMQPEVVTSGDAGFLVVDFRGRLKLRFKKLSHRLHPYNVVTCQQRACDDQTLFGPAATFVTAGYRLTDLGEFRDAHIVCWTGPELRWSVPLPDVLESRQTIAPAAEPDVPLPIIRPRKLREGRAETVG